MSADHVWYSDSEQLARVAKVFQEACKRLKLLMQGKAFLGQGAISHHEICCACIASYLPRNYTLVFAEGDTPFCTRQTALEAESGVKMRHSLF